MFELDSLRPETFDAHLPSKKTPLRENATLSTEQRNFPIPTTRTHYEYTCLPASALPALEEVRVLFTTRRADKRDWPAHVASSWLPLRRKVEAEEIWQLPYLQYVVD